MIDFKKHDEEFNACKAKLLAVSEQIIAAAAFAEIFVKASADFKALGAVTREFSQLEYDAFPEGIQDSLKNLYAYTNDSQNVRLCKMVTALKTYAEGTEAESE